MLRLRDGGWVLVAAALFGVFVLVVVLKPALDRMAQRPPGDGADPASYLFALEPSLVPADTIVPAQFHRDMTEPILEPAKLAGRDVALRNEQERGKLLVSGDPVIGVEIDGEAMAWPLSILKVHEVVNDEVGGVPLLVSWNPLAGAAVVYDRRLPDGTAPRFGVSGLVHDSNLLLYDRADGEQPGGESLWSQLLGRAVTGPAAASGSALARVPFVIVHWADWLARHPGTMVLDRVEAKEEHYKRLNYDRYFATDEIKYPVDPRPGPGEPPAKARCFVALGGAEPVVVPYDVVGANADASGRWRMVEPAGDDAQAPPLVIDFRIRRDPLVLEARTPAGDPAPGLHALWFAWRAQAGELEGTRLGRVLAVPADGAAGPAGPAAE